MKARAAALMLIAALGVTACSGTDDDTVTGVVIDVVGDLTNVESFVLRLPDGTDHTFHPAAGVLFHGTANLSHLRDHLRSGEPVEVRYEELDDGTWSALAVDDA